MKKPRTAPSRLFSTTRIYGFSALVASFAMACGEEPAPQGPPPLFDFAIEVSVTDQEKKPLPRVPVLIDGRTVGFTDREGKFEGTITERPSTDIKLSLGELDGYRFTTTYSVEEPLRVQRGVSGEPQGLPISLRAEATSLVTNYLFWVKVECDDHIGKQACQGLPVRVEDTVQGHTDANGIAHVAYRGVPGRDIKVVIDTPPHDPMNEESRVFEPRQPSYAIKLDFDNSIYVIEDKFTDPVRAAASQRRRPAPRARSAASTSSSRPTKKTPKQAPKQDKSGTGIIDLW